MGLKSVSEHKETFSLYHQSFLCIYIYIYVFTVAEKELGHQLSPCRIVGSPVAEVVRLWRYHRAVNKLNTVSVCLVSSSSHRLFLSARLNLSRSNLVMSDRRRHKRGPSSLCRCTVPLENMTTDITSTRRQIGGMRDTKRTMRETRSADVCGELSDKLPIMRHCLSTNAESFSLNQPFTCR